MSQNAYDQILNQVSQPMTASTVSSKETKNTNVIQGKEIKFENVLDPNGSHVNPKRLFDVNKFVEDVKERSNKVGYAQAMNLNMINSYAIAHDCIRETFFKINNFPIQSYANAYVPIILKATLGNAVHDFIQKNSTVFTELEPSVKVPSIRVSCRMDALINDDVIVEIKSCTFKDYETILKSNKPRDPDFLQVMLYKFLLENHLEEAKKQTNIRSSLPKLDKYNIKYFQFIYLANDVIASESENLSQALQDVNRVKKLLDSKYNQFYFINTVTIDLSTFDVTPYYSWIINKINNLNNYLNNNKIPPLTDPYISKNCFFCLYKQICNQYK